MLVVALALVGVMAVAVYYSASSKATKPAIAGTELASNTQDVTPGQPNSDPQPRPKSEPSKSPATRPAIITRQEWKAKPARAEGKAHAIDRITIHHTGVPQRPDLTIEKKLQNLQVFSQREEKLDTGKLKPAWIDVPYHFYIAVDGKIAEGREIKFASDTNTEYDPTNHATIVVEGNFEKEQPTAEQQASLQAMVAWLAAQYQVPVPKIKSHNDFAKTACPGVNLKKMLPSLLEKIETTSK